METFICYRCGKELPITTFSKNKSNKSGHSYWCKDCNKEYSKIYRDRKVKELSEKKKEYYLNNRKVIREKQAVYRQENIDKIRLQQRQSRKRNIEKARLRDKEKYEKKLGRFCIAEENEHVENYEKAKADNFIGWDRHHRLETHNSDGERRLVQLSKEELKALNMYYDRPAKELIWLTNSEHSKIHLTENIHRKRNEKVVVQYDKKTGEFIAEYKSIEEAKRQLGIFTKGSGINRCCKGLKKSAYGYKWRYKK